MRTRPGWILAGLGLLLSSFGPAALPAQAAQAGELTLTPEKPGAGQRVQAAYRPAAALSDEPRLRLRARLRTAKDPEYPRTIGSSAVATLTPDGEGVYRGAFPLPDSVAADRGVSKGTADSLRRRLGVDRSAWDEAVGRAEAEMVERTLAEDRKEPTGSPEAVTPDGSRVRLEDRLGEDATVVVIWSRRCGPSRQAMPRVVELSDELASEGVPVLAVTGDAPEEARAYLREEDEGLPAGGGPGPRGPLRRGGTGRPGGQ